MSTLDPALVWFVVGLVLVLAEFATPGVILVFIGLGAWVASLTAWLGVTTTLGAQVTVFAVSSLVLLVGLRRFFKKWFMGFTAQNPDAKQILDEFTGKNVRVISPITAAGQGKVEFKGANWNAQSADTIEAGEVAEITGVEGLVLHVRRKA
jgi:membrane protein implicated in regulation of membrane protease activity